MSSNMSDKRPRNESPPPESPPRAEAGVDLEDQRGQPKPGLHDQPAESRLPFSKARCIALVATVTGASFMNTFNGQAAVIILPTIGHDLSIPDSRLQWIISAYSLAFGCFLLLWGRIADIYGKRRIFIAGSAWVAVTTAVNPFIPNEIGFDVFRGLQGLGSAANVPTALGILGTTFRPGKAKNYAFSAYAAGAPLGAIFGNLLAGIVAEFASWKWVFGVIAIASGLVTIAGFLVIPSAPPALATLPFTPSSALPTKAKSKPASIDWLGAVLVTVGLLALLFALTEGNVVGWSTPYIPALIVVSVVLIALFTVWQWHLERKGGRPPLMKVSIFRNKKFSAAMIIMMLFFSSFNGYLVYATYFYQDYQGLSPLQTTLRFIPTGVAGVVTTVVTAQLLHIVPTYLLLLFGNISVSVSSLLFAVPIPTGTNYFAWGFFAMILSVFGADTTWPSLTLFTSHSLPQEDQAMGGALVNAVGQVGRSIGLAIATAIQTAVMAKQQGRQIQDVGPVMVGDEAGLAGLRAADWFNFGTALVSVSVVLVAFRGSGIVGKAGVKKSVPMALEKRQADEEVAEPGRGGGEEGVMQEEKTVA